MIRVVSDTAANLPKDIIEKLNITIVNFQYYINGKLQGNDFNGKEYYDSIRNGAETKTSLISIGQFIETFEKILSNGDEIIYVGLSSGVSGTINSATLAKQQICQEKPGSKIEIIDSLAAGIGEGMLAIEAAKLIQNTKNTIESITEEVKKLRDKVGQYFTVDDLKYLKRTGRISSAVAFIGNALKVKPILTGSEDGHIIMVDKAVGVNNAYKQLADKYDQLVEDKNEDIFITHADNEKGALYLLEKVKEKGLKGKCRIELHEPMTGSHIGPGSVALFFKGIHR
ncbi:MAG: DegV family protein [Erysipelotrichaceae bacterium]